MRSNQTDKPTRSEDHEDGVARTKTSVCPLDHVTITALARTRCKKFHKTVFADSCGVRQCCRLLPLGGKPLKNTSSQKSSSHVKW